MEFSYPPDLPITPFVEEIGTLLSHHQVIVVAGETGSGKTTQLPKICYTLAPNHPGLVGCTQPRRIAATTVAQRVKEELGGNGYLVGCKIRFHDQTTNNTRIKFMTDGVLLAETRQDPLLNRYRIIIVDEAHERNLNIDFLLGYLHRLLKKRTDLQLVITSATIDTAIFSAHFDNAPIVRIEGKTYPVSVIYREEPDDDDEGDIVDRCVQAVTTICETQSPGDVLVFLPTEKDIRTCCELLRGSLRQHTVLPLFGRLQAADQQRIFRPGTGLKVVVATNVAETSLTVPGIRYVVDSGLARIAVYNPRSRTMNLPVAAISRANCDQRTGRCGRVGPGVCFRLYREEDYLNRPEFPVPEIQRANLAEVILQMVALRLGDPFAFPFLDPPKPGAIREGYRMLRELGALSDDGRLTDYGKLMAQLPIDPVISRIIIEARHHNCLKEIVIIAAALAIADPRVRPAEQEQQADQAHASFQHQQSDFLMLLSIWRRCHEEIGSFSWSALKRFCRTYYLSFQRMREWLDLHEQLTNLLRDRHHFTFNDQDASYETVHRSLLAGLFRQCARKKSGTRYQGIGERELLLFPGSHHRPPSGDWIIAGSFIETSRLFALTVAGVEPEWIESAAQKFCAYSWSNPRWQKKTGHVIADETVSLYGLTLFAGRRVNFGRRDERNRAEARRIFIQKAFIDGEITGSFPFLVHNRKLLQRWRETEAKIRKRDVVVDDTIIHDFYENRLPPEVFDRTSLINYLKKKGDRHLQLTEADIVLRSIGDKDLIDYPALLRHGTIEIPLRYHFEPGDERDGVTACIPAALLDSTKEELFDWLVPGLLPEKVAFLLKGLPKRLRKRLIPINDTVDLLLDDLQMYRGSLLRALRTAVFKRYRISIANEDWPTDLPDHLRMRFAVVDPAGSIVRADRDLAALRADAPRAIPAKAAITRLRPADEALVKRLATTVFQDWDFTDIPPLLPVVDDRNRIIAHRYAALQEAHAGRGVSVVYCDTRESARQMNRTGGAALFALQFSEQMQQLRRYLKTALSGPSAVWLGTITGSADASRQAVLHYITKTLFDLDCDIIVERDRFLQCVEHARKQGLFAIGRNMVDSITEMLRARQEIAQCLAKLKPFAAPELVADLQRHLFLLVPDTFLESFTAEDIIDARRYLRGLAVRIERAQHNPRKDADKQRSFMPHLNQAENMTAALNADAECRERYRRYRRLVQEYGISLFAPEIKTSEKVSPVIIEAAWEEMQMVCPPSLSVSSGSGGP